MFRVKRHKRIEQITEVFYRVGFWHRKDDETVTQRRLKLFYSIYYLLFPVSLMAGACVGNNMDEMVFSVETSVMCVVLLSKLLFIIWRKREIIEQLNRICEYGVEDRETFTQINDKLNILMKFFTIFSVLVLFSGICVGLVAPFLGTERKLFVNVGFPSYYKNNEFVFWTGFVFVSTEAIINMISMLFSVIVCYLMANCSLRLTNQLGSFLSNAFAVQLATSALCTCASVYCLAFNPGNNLIENIIFLTILLYNLFDIFMVMYFGNEIQLASDRLSYSLFESNWVDRSQSIKKNVFIFGEFLMKPRQLLVLKLYPLTLHTFMRILNATYSMFNILLNFK